MRNTHITTEKIMSHTILILKLGTDRSLRVFN